MNESDDVVCACKGQGGHPAANVSWHNKDGVQIGKQGKEKQTLTLNNVDKTDSGMYTCVAQSLDQVNDTTSVELIVNSCKYSRNHVRSSM